MDMNDIGRQLGGSISFINLDDPGIEYEIKRDMIKSYIQVFKDHLFNKEHPINIVRVQFVEVISTEIKEEKSMNS